MSRARDLLIGIAALAAVSPVPAQPLSDAQARYLAGTCTNCHGPQGRSAGTVPSLAGMQAALLVERMAMFREGKQPATIMHQIAKGYSARDTEAIAAYFARQSPTDTGKDR
jgi:cytochrome c553